jgi:hypothetical protein
MSKLNLDQALQQLKQFNDVSSLRYDDRATGIFTRTLDLFSKDIVRQRTPELGCEFLIPHDYTDLWGRQRILTTVVEARGASTYGLDADDVTFVDVGFTEDGLKITEIRVGYRWTETQLETDLASMKSSINPGLSIVREAMSNADRVLQEEFHKAAMYGISRRGITGLLNNASVATSDFTSFYPLDPDTTRKEIYDWVINIHSAVEEQTERFTTTLNTCLISQKLRDKLMSIPADTSGTDNTAYDLIKRTLGERGITNFIVRNEVSKRWLERYGFYSSGTNKEIMMFYNNNPETLKRFASNIKTSRLHFDEKGTASQYFRQRFSSVKFDQPLEAIYVTYPTVNAP